MSGLALMTHSKYTSSPSLILRGSRVGPRERTAWGRSATHFKAWKSQEYRSRSSPEAREQKFCLIFDGLSLKSVQYYFKDINLSSTKWRKKISAWGRVETTGAAVNRLCVLSVDCVANVVCLTINLKAPRVLQLTGCHLNIFCPTLEKFSRISDIRNEF